MSKEIYFTPQNILTKSRKMLYEIKNISHFTELPFIPNISALLVIDMQRYFLEKNSHAFLPSATSIIPNINRLIKYFNKKNRPVIFTQHINTKKNAKMLKKWWGDIITKDNEYYKISKDIYFPESKIIIKSQYDAFYKTELRRFLRRNNIKQVVITGVMTNLCCETTARSAFIQNFEVFFVIDGTATQNEIMHRATILNLSYGFAVPVLTEDIINRMKEDDETL